jgi:hypothetical protein
LKVLVSRVRLRVRRASQAPPPVQTAAVSWLPRLSQWGMPACSRGAIASRADAYWA